MLSGCTIIDKGLVKLGMRNTDFDYIVEGKVDKIIIQNSSSLSAESWPRHRAARR